MNYRIVKKVKTGKFKIQEKGIAAWFDYKDWDYKYANDNLLMPGVPINLSPSYWFDTLEEARAKVEELIEQDIQKEDDEKEEVVEEIDNDKPPMEDSCNHAWKDDMQKKFFINPIGLYSDKFEQKPVLVGQRCTKCNLYRSI